MKRTSPNRMTKQHTKSVATPRANRALPPVPHPTARALRLYWALGPTSSKGNTAIHDHVGACHACTMAIEALSVLSSVVLSGEALSKTVRRAPGAALRALEGEPIQLAAAALPRPTATQMLAPGDGTSVARTRTYEIVLFSGDRRKTEERIAIYTAMDQIVHFTSDDVVPTLEAVGYFEGVLVQKPIKSVRVRARVLKGTIQLGAQRRYTVTVPLKPATKR